MVVNTIQRALNYYHLVAFLFGFGILRYPLDYPRIRLSFFYILSVWSIYAYVLYFVLNFLLNPAVNKKKQDSLRFFMICFSISTHLLAAMINIIITIREHKSFNLLINKLNQMDDTLEELGTPKEYRRLRYLTICIIIIWFIIICITYTCNFICYIDLFNDAKALYFPIVLHYPYYSNILIDLMLALLLRSIGTRYDKINDYIRQLSETEECGLRYTWKKTSFAIRHCIRSKVNRKRILWITMHLHLQLSRVALNINNLFEKQVTVHTMSNLVSLTTIFYVQYPIILNFMNGCTQDWKYLLCSSLFGAINLIRVTLLNNICESVSANAEKTKDIIYKLTNIIYFAKAREEICQFVLQISLRPLKFSGMGLFYFGHKFLWKCFIWIFSVIILVIQLSKLPLYQIEFNNENITCRSLHEI